MMAGMSLMLRVLPIWACITVAIWCVLATVAYSLETGHVNPWGWVTLAGAIVTVVCGRFALGRLSANR